MLELLNFVWDEAEEITCDDNEEVARRMPCAAALDSLVSASGKLYQASPAIADGENLEGPGRLSRRGKFTLRP